MPTAPHIPIEGPVDQSENRLAVMVSTHLPVDPKMDGLRFEWRTRRGTIVDLHDFTYTDKRLEFYISTKLTPSWNFVWRDQKPKNIIGMTFIDMCWLSSSGTTPQSVIECATPVRATVGIYQVMLGDITQVLPSKLADDIIECVDKHSVGKLNGLFEDAIIYGPIHLAKKEARK